MSSNSFAHICQTREKQTITQVPVCPVPQGNQLGKISSSNLQDEAPTPLTVVGPLFISLLLFHLSRVAWRFGIFRCVYSSFHNRLDLIREPAFYWVFYFSFPINLVYFIICSDESGLFVLVH